MKRFQTLIQHFFPPAIPLKPGVFHFQSPGNAVTPLRLHLRVEPGGAGLLIVNAQTVLHLNQTATEYVYHWVCQTPEVEIGKTISRRYRISADQAVADFKNLRARIESLIQTPDLDPDTFLDMERASLYSSATTAPYRLDCAVTYRLTDSSPSVAPVERVSQELSTDCWKTILEKAWKAGIPHVIFTGGEATLREDLPDLMGYAENLGMVTGLLTNGLRLADRDFLKSILFAGLDHIMLILDPDNQDSWNAVAVLSAEDISLCVHLTLAPDNIIRFPQILTQLNNHQIKLLSLSVSKPELKDALKSAQRQTSEAGLSLVWDLPVPYSKFNPVAFELEGFEEFPQGAGKGWLYVEPDGDVLLSQGFPHPIGNLLTDPWEQIWTNNPALVS